LTSGSARSIFIDARSSIIDGGDNGCFAPKLRARVGTAAANAILRDNVVYAFRKGSRVP